MPTRLLLAVLLAINLVGCASSRDRAYQDSVREYKQKNAVVVKFAQGKVKQLVVATKAYQASNGYWPQLFNELVGFTFANNVPLDPTDFNSVTFATLNDGSVQIHYDVNCSSFSTPQNNFTQTGAVNVKAGK